MNRAVLVASMMLAAGCGKKERAAATSSGEGEAAPFVDGVELGRVDGDGTRLAGLLERSKSAARPMQ